MPEYLYVCLFSSGFVKVGRSIDPQARIASHVERVSCLGVALTAHHIVSCVGDAEPREATLIARCVEAATSRHKHEWFAGLDFETVCAWATEVAEGCAADVPAEIKALDEAVAAAGSMVRLASLIGVAPCTPSMWRTRRRIPADYCPAIERETGVRCERLRPDVPWHVLRNTNKEN